MTLENQLHELKEDLLQVSYPDNHENTYILDIGWYPEFNLNGNFKLVLVRNFEQDTPVIMRASDFQDIYNALTDCIDYVNGL